MDALELSPSTSTFQVLGVMALMWQVGDSLPKDDLLQVTWLPIGIVDYLDSALATVRSGRAVEDLYLILILLSKFFTQKSKFWVAHALPIRIVTIIV